MFTPKIQRIFSVNVVLTEVHSVSSVPLWINFICGFSIFPLIFQSYDQIQGLHDYTVKSATLQTGSILIFAKAWSKSRGNSEVHSLLLS